MGIKDAEQDVVFYESGREGWSTERLLGPCSKDTVQQILQKSDVDAITVVDEMCGLIRRVESAACNHKNENNPTVQNSVNEVTKSIACLEGIRKKIEKLTPKTNLEKAGKFWLMSKIDWAEKILKVSLPEWGYK
jgi:hypothetical protein